MSRWWGNAAQVGPVVVRGALGWLRGLGRKMPRSDPSSEATQPRATSGRQRQSPASAVPSRIEPATRRANAATASNGATTSRANRAIQGCRRVRTRSPTQARDPRKASRRNRPTVTAVGTSTDMAGSKRTGRTPNPVRAWARPSWARPPKCSATSDRYARFHGGCSMSHRARRSGRHCHKRSTWLARAVPRWCPPNEPATTRSWPRAARSTRSSQPGAGTAGASRTANISPAEASRASWRISGRPAPAGAARNRAPSGRSGGGVSATTSSSQRGSTAGRPSRASSGSPGCATTATVTSSSRRGSAASVARSCRGVSSRRRRRWCHTPRNAPRGP